MRMDLFADAFTNTTDLILRLQSSSPSMMFILLPHLICMPVRMNYCRLRHIIRNHDALLDTHDSSGSVIKFVILSCWISTELVFTGHTNCLHPSNDQTYAMVTATDYGILHLSTIIAIILHNQHFVVSLKPAHTKRKCRILNIQFCIYHFTKYNI